MQSAIIALLLSVPLLLMGQGSLLLVGGGSEDAGGWSDAPYGWFVQAADSGIIINIDVDPASSWYPGYFRYLGADQASQALRIPDQATANDSATYNLLISASGIFMEGGDQWDYISTWKGTLVEEALEQVFAAGGALGGTSAGLAVLGEIVFDARHGSAYPEEVAYDPYDYYVQFTDDFLSVLPGVLTDSHFHNRGRIGRLVPMLARRHQDEGEDLLGVGISEQTALTIDPSGSGAVHGLATVTFLSLTPESEVNCQPDQPPTVTHIQFDQLLDGGRYDLNNRMVISGGPFLSNVVPINPPDLVEPLQFDSDSLGVQQYGAWVVNGMHASPNAAWDGDLTLDSGAGIIPNSALIPNVWSDNDHFENHWIGGLFAAAMHPGVSSFWWSGSALYTFGMDMQTADAGYVLTTGTVAQTGVNTVTGSNYPGITGAKLHFLGNDDSIPFYEVVTSIISDSPVVSHDFNLAVYPNPTNAAVTIKVDLRAAELVDLNLFDLQGQLVMSKPNESFVKGRNTIKLDVSALGSAIYILRFSTRFFDLHKRLVVIK